MKPAPEPLVILHLTDKKNRALDVALDRDCKHWSDTPLADLDALERQLEEEHERTLDPYNGDPPSRRSDKELNRVLAILDEIESGKGKA